uniref:Uncharacterized protein n=1 Tax=Arundo donax TaxID=35708 RepID=A0A0A9BN32_ARUDO
MNRRTWANRLKMDGPDLGIGVLK